MVPTISVGAHLQAGALHQIKSCRAARPGAMMVLVGLLRRSFDDGAAKRGVLGSARA